MKPPFAESEGGARQGSRSEIPWIPVVRQLMSVRSESGGKFAVCFPAFEHVKFVAVLRGGFDLLIEGEAQPSRIRCGDCYVLASGRPYRIFNAPVPEADAATLYAADRAADGVVRWGRGAIDTVTIGARATLDPVSVTYLREKLPAFVGLPAAAPEAVRFRELLSSIGGAVDAVPGKAFAADECVGLLLAEALRYLLRNGCSSSDQNPKSSATPRVRGGPAR